MYRYPLKTADVTKRVVHVTGRYFIIFISFDTFKTPGEASSFKQAVEKCVNKRKDIKMNRSEKINANSMAKTAGSIGKDGMAKTAGAIGKTGKRELIKGSFLLLCFAVWTLMINIVDVKPWGQNGTDIGFASFNTCFHSLTGVNMTLYNVTDWLGLVPISVCMVFAVTGLIQLIKRKSLFKVDIDIIILGIYYTIVIFAYMIFEIIPINYRPVLINGYLEASYPSSTTLLVLCVMPTLVEQIGRRIGNAAAVRAISVITVLFSAFMVIGRLISGVHWFTDIIGSVLLSAGLFCIYKGAVMHVNGSGCETRQVSAAS